MNKTNYFILTEVILIVIISVIRFKSFKMFLNGLFSFVFRWAYVFSKRQWNEHFERSFNFTIYLLIVFFFTIINILVFKYLI